MRLFFAPKSVAVIGASETAGSVGRTVLWNLVSSPFGGTVYPVNDKRASVLGIKAYPNLAAVPAQIDVAVIITPAPTIPFELDEVAEKVGLRSRRWTLATAAADLAGAGPRGWRRA